MTDASNELAARQSEYRTRLDQASAAHAALEQKLVDADQQLAAVLKSASTQLTELQKQYETRLVEVTTARENISRQLHETETTLARVRQESEANASASAERIRQRESELAADSANRHTLEGKLGDTEAALKESEARALADRTAMQQQSAQRQAEFDAQLAREVAEYEGQLEDLQTELGALNVERDGLRECLANSQTQLESLSRLHEDAKDNFERIRQAKEIELQRLADDHAAVRQ